ncbi:hypothetical protein EUGRSUZ_L02151 [Eucalyptus grandis]|uniref:DUF4283 domain-containing protein n=1 Tax=Eucalyptus grandis TaxID=71139 RepID=A0A058ZRG2_EUCGR|nr:hypothetical protein EUGRSUZ_L02151 [Eucalyptus grandis]
MADREENHLRLAALCHRMGDLWSEDDITDLGEEIPEEAKQQSDLTLYGKLYSKPNANFQALSNTMKRAWKVDSVKCEQIEPGYFSFIFPSSEEKRRVLETGPWSFMSNLLVLKEGDPNIPEHCYEFMHYAFWVHFIGLPRARVNEGAIRLLASRLGKVEEIKIEARGTNTRKNGKAKVLLNLSSPLKTDPLATEEEVVMETPTEVLEKRIEITMEDQLALAIVPIQAEKIEKMSITRRHNAEQQQAPPLYQAGIETSSQNSKKGKATYKAPAAKKTKGRTHGPWWLALISHQSKDKTTKLELSRAGQPLDSPALQSPSGSREAQLGVPHGN